MYFIMHVPIILDMDVHVMQMIKVKKDFRIISGNPRQFNYRDESAGVCVSAQKI